MDASFQVAEEGLSHQLDMPDLTPPDEETIAEGLKQRPFLSWRQDHRRLLVESPQEPVQHIWIKANGVAPEDPRLNMVLLAYESDEALLGTSRMPHRGSFNRENMQVASLDHSIWFHRQVNVNDWLLYSLNSPAAGGARGYTQGTIHTSGGDLVASCMQEGLIRVRATD